MKNKINKSQKELRSIGLRLAVFCKLLVLSVLFYNCPQEGGNLVTVFESKIGIPTVIYRIPSITKTAAGTLLAFAEKRESYFDDGNKDIVMKRSFDNGNTWSDEQNIDSNENNSSANPVPIYDAVNDRLVLLFSHFSGPEWDAHDNRLYVTLSDDEGATWTERKEISDVIPDINNLFLGGPGHGIQLTKAPYAGRLMVPAWTWGGIVQLIYSDDFGQNWNLGAISTEEEIPLNNNETHIAELSDGTVYILSRNAGGDSDKVKSESFSQDGGESFTDVSEETDKFPGPVVQGTLLSFDDGLLLFSSPQNDSQRESMGIIASTNDGESFGAPYMITENGAAYSDMAKLNENTVGVFFEHWDTLLPYTKIVYTNVDIDAIPRD